MSARAWDRGVGAGALLLAGAVVIYLAGRAGGPVGAFSAVASVGLGLFLLLRGTPEELSRVGNACLSLLPGALVVFLSFNAGGFFPDTPAVAATALAILLAAHAVFAPRPFAGFSRPLAVAAGALALYSLWTLTSAAWSDSLSRALIEFDRSVLYLLALLLFGSVARTPGRARLMLIGLAGGILIVCMAGFLTRVLPDAFSAPPNLVPQRLSHPLTYWNALGLLAGIGGILLVHLASSATAHPVSRIFGAAALPIVAATLLLTYSRGAIAAAILGLLAYVLLGRPRAGLSAVLATGPPTAVAVVAAYRADLLASTDPTSAAATAQGHKVAGTVLLCVLAAAAVRWLLLAVLDRRLADARLPERARQPVMGAAAAAAALVVIVAVVALDLPGVVSAQYERLFERENPARRDIRSRLSDPSSAFRVDNLRVALRAFADAPLRGGGAGTFELMWARERASPRYVTDAHSVYIETLGELGVVGLVLLAVTIVAIVLALARRMRRRNRPLYAALLAAVLAWALHAGIDWDWEMPAVTLWVFAVGGTALALSATRPRRSRSVGLAVRVAAAAGCLVLAIFSGLVALSHSRLEEGVAAVYRGDCRAGLAAASDSSSLLSFRPESHEVMGYCHLARRADDRAVESMRAAVSRDPENWEFHYALALAQASAGQDPRPAARVALRLNPREPVVREAVARFRGNDRRRWRRWARAAARPEELSFPWAGTG